MATEADLERLGFRACSVTPKTLNVVHPGTVLGPFCRLTVEDRAPLASGVYAWAKDGDVMYVGKADVLRQVVHGARMQRAYNDYTYIPAFEGASSFKSSRPRQRLAEQRAMRWGGRPMVVGPVPFHDRSWTT